MTNRINTVLILIFILLDCNQQQSDGQKQIRQKVSVKVIKIVPSQFVSKGIYFGRLVPAFSAKIISYSGGRVETVKVHEGDYVKKGNSLAEIDAAKALTMLQTTEVQERITLSTLEQTRIHLKNGNASRLRVDEAEMNYLSAANNRINAHRNYQGALAISPISGIVTSSYIEQYDEIAEGTHVFTVSKMDEMKLNVDIMESDAYYLKTGTEARLSIGMMPGREWTGKVRTFAKEADETTRAFRTEIYFDNYDGALKPGIAGRVEIDLQHFDSAVVIPTELIIIRGIQKSVMVVKPDCKVEQRFIETGPKSDSHTLVYSGLSFGEFVITEGYNMVGGGDEVMIGNNRKN